MRYQELRCLPGAQWLSLAPVLLDVRFQSGEFCLLQVQQWLSASSVPLFQEDQQSEFIKESNLSFATADGYTFPAGARQPLFRSISVDYLRIPSFWMTSL